MVRNEELRPTSYATRLLAETVCGLIDAQSLSRNRVCLALGRSQTYVSIRIRGMAPWNTDDLDKLAKLFGYSNLFSLMDVARGTTPRELVRKDM